MTLKEARREIFNLNFESEERYTESPSIIIDAINRAMNTITAEVRPIMAEYRISQHPIKNIAVPSFSFEQVIHYNPQNGEHTFKAKNARAFTFETDGNGVVRVEDEGGSRGIILAGNGEYNQYRGFVSGDALLIFGGEFSYNIKNIAVYDEVVSANEGDIKPYRERNRYDFKQLTKVDGKEVFLGFGKKVLYSDNAGVASYKPLKSFEVENRHILYLPSNLSCEIEVFYRRQIKQVKLGDPDDSVLELDADVAVLLPLLASYYVWLDDERSRAQEYYNNFEMRRNGILDKERNAVATVIQGGVL